MHTLKSILMSLEFLKGLQKYADHLRAYTGPETFAEIIDSRDSIRMQVIFLLRNIADFIGPSLSLRTDEDHGRQLGEWRRRFMAALSSGLTPEQVSDVNIVTDRFLFGGVIDRALDRDQQSLIEKIGIREDISEKLMQVSASAIKMMNICGKRGVRAIAKNGRNSAEASIRQMTENVRQGNEIITSLPLEAVLRLDLFGDLEGRFRDMSALVEEYLDILCGKNPLERGFAREFAHGLAKNFVTTKTHRQNCEDPNIWKDIKAV